MSCENVQNSFLDYLEGNLSNVKSQDVRQHLAECKTCAVLLNQMKVAIDIIEVEKKIEPTPFLFTRVMSKIEKLESQVKHNYLVPVYQRIMQPAIAIVLVALAILSGVELGNLYNVEHSNNQYPTEMVYMNDVTMESLDSYVKE